MMRALPIGAALLAAALALAGCGNKEQAQNDDVKKDLDQLVQASKDLNAQAKEIASGTKSNEAALKSIADRIAAMHADLAGQLAKQKRGALAIALETETVCDNDAQCSNTARAVCNKINYPNAVTSRFTPGIRPVLNSVICFD